MSQPADFLHDLSVCARQMMGNLPVGALIGVANAIAWAERERDRMRAEEQAAKDAAPQIEEKSDA